MRLAVMSTAIAALSIIIPSTQSVSVPADLDWRTALVEEVSGINILESVIELESLGTRDFHTEQATEAAVLIELWMKELGLSTELQEFIADGVVSLNVIGTLNPGNTAEGVVLFGAHYDSRNRYAITTSEAENVTAPGADDNASGVGAMLEIARILSECEKFNAATRFVAFGAEERGFEDRSGLAGSAAFAESEAAAGVEYRAAFVMDMIGFQAEFDERATVVCDNSSEAIAQSVLAAVDRYGLDLTLDLVANESVQYSDHASFWATGYPSILAIEQLDPYTHTPVNPHYHSESDTSDKLSTSQMEGVAAALIGATLDLTTQGEDSYDTAYSLVAVAAVSTAVALAAITVIRRKKGVS